MIGAVLIAIASAAGQAPAGPPCLPKSRTPRQHSSAIEDHRSLRQAIGEPMPQSPIMVMLYGKGGHLATEEYSLVLAKALDGVWRGTAVGRSRVWVKDAPCTPMERFEWVLDATAGDAVDRAITRRCSHRDPHVRSADLAPPPPGFIFEIVDILRPRHSPVTFYATAGGGRIAALIRPPRVIPHELSRCRTFRTRVAATKPGPLSHGVDLSCAKPGTAR